MPDEIVLPSQNNLTPYVSSVIPAKAGVQFQIIAAGGRSYNMPGT